MTPDERARRFAREGWIATQLAALSDEQLDRVDEIVTKFRVDDLDEQASLPRDLSAPAVLRPPKVDYAFTMSDVDDAEGA